MTLDQATRAGACVLYMLTTIPLRKASAKRMARLYRKREPLETAGQPLAAYFHVPGETMDQELSLYSVTNDIAPTDHGIMISLRSPKASLRRCRAPGPLPRPALCLSC